MSVTYIKNPTYLFSFLISSDLGAPLLFLFPNTHIHMHTKTHNPSIPTQSIWSFSRRSVHFTNLLANLIAIQVANQINQTEYLDQLTFFLPFLQLCAVYYSCSCLSHLHVINKVHWIQHPEFIFFVFLET